jgi:hypothetical protein
MRQYFHLKEYEKRSERKIEVSCFYIGVGRLFILSIPISNNSGFFFGSAYSYGAISFLYRRDYFLYTTMTDQLNGRCKES